MPQGEKVSPPHSAARRRPDILNHLEKSIFFHNTFCRGWSPVDDFTSEFGVSFFFVLLSLPARYCFKLHRRRRRIRRLVDVLVPSPLSSLSSTAVRRGCCWGVIREVPLWEALWLRSGFTSCVPCRTCCSNSNSLNLPFVRIHFQLINAAKRWLLRELGNIQCDVSSTWPPGIRPWTSQFMGEGDFCFVFFLLLSMVGPRKRSPANGRKGALVVVVDDKN